MSHDSLHRRLTSAEFGVRPGGYHRAEVDRFLRSCADELATLEAQQLVAQARSAWAAEQTLEPESAETEIRRRMDEAGRILEQAELVARRTTTEAEQRAERILAEAEATRRQAEAEAKQLRERAALKAHEVFELGRSRAAAILDEACGTLEELEGDGRRLGRAFDREAHEERQLAAGE